MNALEFIRDFSDKMHGIETARAQAGWDLATTGSEESKARLVELEIRYRALFEPEEDVRRIQELYRERSAYPQETRRQIEQLYLSYLSDHVEPTLARQIAELSTAVESRFMDFRALLHGQHTSDNELREVLRTSRSSDEVRQAWEASKEVGAAVEQDVVRLALLRNAAARALGFADHQQQSFATQELDSDELWSLLDELERETREPFRLIKKDFDRKLCERFGIAEAELRPWHYGDPFFQELPPSDELALNALFEDTSPEELSRKTYRALGMDVDGILRRSDLHERDHKDQHAFCVHVDRLSDDVRVLANLRRDEYWTGTMLHELGHAVYDTYLGASLPFLLRRPPHTSSTEAIAMLMGRLTRDPQWLRWALDADPAQVASMASGLAREQQFAMLVFMRWALVVVTFERELHQNPQRADVNRLWWDLVEHFQMLRRPDDRDRPDWAAKIHIALYPAYYQNYILGELTASQIQEALERECGGLVARPEAGDFLRQKMFALGALYPWNETVRLVSGEKLRPAYFAAQFVGPAESRA